jgi:peptide/nickel transport system permease protein
VSYARFVARRLGFAALSAYVAVTAIFALITFTPNTDLGGKLAEAARGGASPEALEQIRQRYLQTRGLDEPILDRYVDWLVDVTTLDWGYSFTFQQPVWDVLTVRVPTTLEYVVPGVVLAFVLGVGVGLFAAMTRGSVFDRVSRVASYALLGVPSFVGLVWYTHFSGADVIAIAGTASVKPGIHPQVLAAAAVAVSLLAGQIRFSRTASLEQAGEEFVKLVRAKGASRLRVARHVLRNAALPIVSLSITEILAVLMLNIYVVEAVLGIDGLARASLSAVYERDLPLLIGTTMVLVFVGIGGNLLQDALYGYLDPTINED